MRLKKTDLENLLSGTTIRFASGSSNGQVHYYEVEHVLESIWLCHEDVHRIELNVFIYNDEISELNLDEFSSKEDALDNDGTAVQVIKHTKSYYGLGTSITRFLSPETIEEDK